MTPMLQWYNQYRHQLKYQRDVSLFLVGEGVGADPGVWDGDAGGDAEAGQVGGQGALQQVGGAAHSVLRLAHIQTLGKEASVVRCQGTK